MTTFRAYRDEKTPVEYDRLVIDARPGQPWGNPFQVGGHYLNRNEYLECPFPAEGPPRHYTSVCRWSGETISQAVQPVLSPEHAAYLFLEHIRLNNHDYGVKEIREQLKGKTIICSCPPGQSCHVDILVSIAEDEA